MVCRIECIALIRYKYFHCYESALKIESVLVWFGICIYMCFLCSCQHHLRKYTGNSKVICYSSNKRPYKSSIKDIIFNLYTKTKLQGCLKLVLSIIKKFRDTWKCPKLKALRVFSLGWFLITCGVDNLWGPLKDDMSVVTLKGWNAKVISYPSPFYPCFSLPSWELFIL